MWEDVERGRCVVWEVWSVGGVGEGVVWEDVTECGGVWEGV